MIDYTGDLASQLRALGVPEMDYILCFNDTDRYFSLFADIIKPQGKICSIVEAKAPVNLGSLMRKSVTFAWELMFTRSMFGTSDMVAQHNVLNETAALIEQGVLKTILAQNLGRINAANLKRAHKLLEEGHAIGKVVLEGF